MYLFSVGGDHSVYLGTVFGFFGLFWILVGFFFIKGGDKKAMAHFFLCGLILCIGFTIRAFQDGLVWPLGIDLVVIDVLLLTLIQGMGADALSALRDSYQAVILQSFGVGGVPGGGSGPFARAMEDWLRAGKTIVMMTQVPYEGSDMAVYQVGYQVKEKYQLMEAYNMTLEAAATKLMWVLGQTRDSEEVRRLFYQPVQWDIIR